MDSADEAIEKVENALAASGVSGFRVTGSARLMPHSVFPPDVGERANRSRTHGWSRFL
jgi:hypothetical protein